MLLGALVQLPVPAAIAVLAARQRLAQPLVARGVADFFAGACLSGMTTGGIHYIISGLSLVGREGRCKMATCHLEGQGWHCAALTPNQTISQRPARFCDGSRAARSQW
jgi:hypothetical protein